MYLTPAATSYLTQLILAALVSVYLAYRARQPGQPRHTRLLAAFFVALAAFLAASFLEMASLPSQRLLVVFAENTLLGAMLVCLLRFAYHFPVSLPALRWEARLALLVTSLYTLGEAAYATFRFIEISAGQVFFRQPIADQILVLVFCLVPLTFLRQSYALTSGGPRGWLAAIRRPDSLASYCARASASFALIFLFTCGLAYINLQRSFLQVYPDVANPSISLGILAALSVFTLIYLNCQAETTSFLVKVAGATLTVMLAILSTVSWIIASPYATQYQPALPDGRTLRFSPNAAGGYDISKVPFHFQTDLGQSLPMRDGPERNPSVALDFAFPFYGQVYKQVHARFDGALSMGQPVPYRSFQYHYGAGAPLILPLLLDLSPDTSPGGVFARQEPDQLVITWYRVRAQYVPRAEFTFQVVLHQNGVFEISYQGLAQNLVYQPNDEPGANPWAIGVIPGGLKRGARPQIVQWDVLPVQTGPGGAIQDYLLEFRAYLNEMFIPLAGLILVASLLIVAGFPLLFYFSLVSPLNALLEGVRRAENRDFSSGIPVLYPDEIGFLTRAFNRMSAELGDLVNRLETRVAARTRALDEANAQLRCEIAERQIVNEQLKVRMAEIEQLQAELREQVLRDPLTGLYNRRYLQDILERELTRAKREQKSLSIIIADLDHFKNVNDIYGHKAGDQCLMAFTELIKHHTRSSDIACRYGGEEFMLVLPGVNSDVAAQRADEIRQRCADLCILHEDSRIKITASFGVATYPADGEETEQIVIRADKAMYKSKQDGRNCVTTWDQSMESVPGKRIPENSACQM